MRNTFVLSLLATLFISSGAYAAKKTLWANFEDPSEHEPEAIGGYANGCLSGGQALPTEGRGYQVVRLSRNRYYGHPDLLDYVEDLGNKVADKDLGIMLVADMNQPRGGPMPNGHSSHQSGLDADIWLPLDYGHIPGKRDNLKSKEMANREKFVINRSNWTDKQAQLIKLAAEDNRVARIFVNPVIKVELCKQQWDDRKWLRKVRPWWKHHTHFHVRLKCPLGDKECKNQASPPAGDGCGAELTSWYPENRKKTTVKRKPKAKPPLPQRCRSDIASR